MRELPDDFADTLALVIEPDHRDAAANIIEAATLLDDDGLRRFLEMFAARIRRSAIPLKPEELQKFLRVAGQRGHEAAP